MASLVKKCLFITVSCLAVGFLISFFVAPRFEASAYMLVDRQLFGKDQARSEERDEAELGTLAQILLSEDVLRGAEKQIRATSHEQIETLRLKNSLSARVEPKSRIIKVSGRDDDPNIAAIMVNSVVDAFSEYLSHVRNEANRSQFLDTQTAIASQKLRFASSTLKDFVSKSGIYSLEDQTKLLLTQQADVKTSMSKNQVSIKDREAQVATLLVALGQLRQVANNPEVANIVKQVEKTAKLDGVNSKVAPLQTLSGQPPILLVKVFQDSMQDLLHTVAELNGLRSAEQVQKREVDDLQANLQNLARQSPEYVRLKREEDLAFKNFVSLSSEAADAQVRYRSKLTGILDAQIVQRASPPIAPLYNRLLVFCLLGLAVGAVLSTALVFMRGLWQVGEEATRDARARNDQEVLGLDKIQKQEPSFSFRH